MLIIPAIDLKNGECVRLRQGLMEDSTVFSDSPISTAQRWVNAGARRLHLVDLNGAFDGKPVNKTIIEQITNEFPDLPIQIGGGIRNIETISSYINSGVKYVIIGTKAVENPDFVKLACKEFPDNIIIGLDAKNGIVATDGWAKLSNFSVIDLAKKFEQDGIQSIIYTDIARDGMMQGVNIEATVNLAENVTIPIIASGGITNMSDIKNLTKVANCGIEGAITGRAIYENTLDLSEAQAYADANTPNNLN